MTTARCPACGAAVAIGAPWCTLWFADLRPAPEPVAAHPVEPIPPQPADLGHTAGAVALADPLADPLTDPLPDLVDRPVVKRSDADTANPTWPCSGCGQQVGLDSDTCPVCLTPFLGGATDLPSLRLPVVGEVSSLTKAGRIGLCAGGVLAATVLFVLVGFVLGHLF